MFATAVVLFGLVSLDRLPLNLLPDISYPSLTLRTAYLDAAPEEVENLITRPIEEAAGGVPGLKRLSSVSRTGQSEVVLEFSWNTNMDLASLEVREKLDAVTLPQGVGKSIILRFDPARDPIMRLRLFGESADLSLTDLRYAAEKQVKKDLEATDGVAAVQVMGGVEEQIHIEIDEKRLAELGIAITEVTRLLDQANLNQATGSLEDLDARYQVRMLNQFGSVDDIRQTILHDVAGSKIILGDVAKVWRGAKEQKVIARLDGKETVELSIYKEGSANTVTVAGAVKQRLSQLQSSGLFPSGIAYRVVFNQAEFIENAIHNVLQAALIGGLLATLVLFLFLRDLRSTLIIGSCIPISVLATFALMYQTGITLNIMSLSGVALGVGMLVDNSIVVLESVHRHLRQGGKRREAVLRGATEVGRAVTASTLSTVAVFLPLIFVEGIAGQLFKDQALTITYSLLASLLVALTVIPMILALGFKQQTTEAGEHWGTAPAIIGPHPSSGFFRRSIWNLQAILRKTLRLVFIDVVILLLVDLQRLVRGLGRLLLRILAPLLNVFEAGFTFLAGRYPGLLIWSLGHKKTVFLTVVLLVGVAGILSFRLGAELLPSMSQGEFAFEVRLPEGRLLQSTDQVVRDVETRVLNYPGVRSIFSSVGTGSQNQFDRGLERENLAEIYAVLENQQDRQTEEEIIEGIRSELREYPEVTYSFRRPAIFSWRAPIEIEIYTFDLEASRAAAQEVARVLAGIEGLSDVQTSTRPGSPEIRIRFDRQRLSRLGLEERQISNILRNKIRGDVATRYRDEDRQIDILVRAGEGDRGNIEAIKRLVVATGTSGGLGQNDEEPLQAASASTVNGKVPIRLGAVAQVFLDRGPSAIHRISSQRAAVVTANLSGRALSVVSEEIRSELNQLRDQLGEAVTLVLAGQNEELNTSFNSLLFALALAVFLVYLVLASQFESLIHPFVIIFTLPLGALGVVLALSLTGMAVSVMVFLGCIILSGIVVNNAIVLIDYTNQLRQRGLSRYDAVVEAARVRLRPIVMTTLTTVLGLIPMALSLGQGSETWAPMAVALIGGLLCATLLTLIVIPLVYELVDRKVYVLEEAD